MKRYIPKFESGFSLAELLISMTIAMVIAVALVPVVGMKKVRVPINNMNHGIAECYYDTSGKLHYFYAISDRETRPMDTVIEEGDTCTFKAPRAHYFEVITVGAGGDGSTQEPALYKSVSIQGLSYYGYINIDENFQNDIAKADDRIFGLANKIRLALDNWAEQSPNEVVAQYSLRSPLGNSGASVCTPYVLGNGLNDQNSWGNCPQLCPDNGVAAGRIGACPGPGKRDDGAFWYDLASARDEIQGSGNCWVYLHGRGSDSQAGRQSPYDSPISIPINSTSKISIVQNYTKAMVSVVNTNKQNNNSITYSVELGRSADGDEPVLKQDPTTQLDRYVLYNSLNMDPRCIPNNLPEACNLLPVDKRYKNEAPAGGKEDDVNFGCSDNITYETMGKVEYKENAYKWNYVKGKYYTKRYDAGTRGDINSMVYENMTGNFTMHPARSNADVEGEPDANKSYILFGTDKKALLSKSGANAKYRNHGLTINKSDLPIIKEVYDKVNPQNRDDEKYAAMLAKINGAGFKGGLFDCKDDLCPGFAGWSPYIYLPALSSDYNLTLTNIQTGSSYTEYGEGYTPSNVQPTCKDGSQPESPTFYEDNMVDIKICRGVKSKANPGAVIIIW